jgi:hypothetical protein
VVGSRTGAVARRASLGCVRGFPVLSIYSIKPKSGQFYPDARQLDSCRSAAKLATINRCRECSTLVDPGSRQANRVLKQQLGRKRLRLTDHESWRSSPTWSYAWLGRIADGVTRESKGALAARIQLIFLSPPRRALPRGPSGVPSRQPIGCHVGPRLEPAWMRSTGR